MTASIKLTTNLKEYGKVKRIEFEKDTEPGKRFVHDFKNSPLVLTLDGRYAIIRVNLKKDEFTA